MQNYPQQPQAKGRELQTQVGQAPAYAPLSAGATPNNPVVVSQAAPQPGREGQAAAGLAQVLGLDPRVAILAIALDTMLFAGEIISMGILMVFSIVAGVVFGFITYRAQKSWYGDNHESAKIKALMMGLLTAIPTALPAFLYLPAGLVGLVHVIRKK